MARMKRKQFRNIRIVKNRNDAFNRIMKKGKLTMAQRKRVDIPPP